MLGGMLGGMFGGSAFWGAGAYDDDDDDYGAGAPFHEPGPPTLMPPSIGNGGKWTHVWGPGSALGGGGGQSGAGGGASSGDAIGVDGDDDDAELRLALARSLQES
jgi:hypothetical protein